MSGGILKNPKWIKLFTEFATNIRIPSKEIQSYDHNDPGVPLNLWTSQKRYLEEIAEGLERGVRTFICLKGRQEGISTVSVAVLVFWCAFFPSTQAALVTDTAANAAKFRALIKTYINSFPKGFLGSFKIMKGRDNREMIGFTNGSVIDFLVAGKNSGANRNKTLGESRGYNVCLCTEVANYGSAEGLQSFRETLAEKHENRLFLYESTAKGWNLYKDLYEEGLRDPISKKAFFIGWWSKNLNSLDPKGPAPEPHLYALYSAQPPDADEREKMKIVLERYNFAVSMKQLAWYRWRQADKSTSAQDLAQNQPWVAEEAFVLSGQSFFQIRLLQKHLERLSIPDNPDNVFWGYRFLLGQNFLHSKMDQILSDISLVELRVWEEPDVRGSYVIGCDPAWGRNPQRDRHAISICRCYADCLIQVAEFASNAVDTRQAAWILAYLAGAYRNCVINIEVTGGSGLAVLNELKSVRNQLQVTPYQDQLKNTPWEDFMSNARWYLYKRYDNMAGGGSITHWQTDRARKWEVMNQLRDSLVKEEFITNSLPLLEEMCSVVVTDDGKIEAPGRNKDDRVFAAALANRAWIDQVRPMMLVANATYAAVHSNQPGTETGLEGLANRAVSDFFKRASEADEGPKAPAWMRARGLVG